MALEAFEQGKGNIDILFTTQKGAEGHNFHSNDNDDCYIFFNDWNTGVQFAGRFRDGLRKLRLIGDFGGEIKTPTSTARYVADGLTFEERNGNEEAASNLLIRERGLPLLPYVLRQIYNIKEIKIGNAQFDVAPKSKSLTFLQIVKGNMQDVMLDGLHIKRKDSLLKAFNNLCIPYHTDCSVLSNLSLLYAQVCDNIEGGADSNKVLYKLPDNLRCYGLLNYLGVPYVPSSYVRVDGGIYTPSRKGERKGKAVGKAIGENRHKTYLPGFVAFIDGGGLGEDVQRRYRGRNLEKGELAALYENGGRECYENGSRECYEKFLACHSIYTNEKPKKNRKTMNTPPPPPPTVRVTKEPPPPPTIRVITEPQLLPTDARLASGGYGKVEQEQYAKGEITAEEFNDHLTGEQCPF